MPHSTTSLRQFPSNDQVSRSKRCESWTPSTRFRRMNRSRYLLSRGTRVDLMFPWAAKVWQRWEVSHRAAKANTLHTLIRTRRLERRASTRCWLRRTGRWKPKRDQMPQSCESISTHSDPMTSTMTTAYPDQVCSPPPSKTSKCVKASNPNRQEDRGISPSSQADSTSKPTKRRCIRHLTYSRISSHLMWLPPCRAITVKSLNLPPKVITWTPSSSSSNLA